MFVLESVAGCGFTELALLALEGGTNGTGISLPLAIDKKRRIDFSYEIASGSTKQVRDPRIARSYSERAFSNLLDHIIVDECHRWSAADDSAWRDILTSFSSATQIGTTAIRPGSTVCKSLQVCRPASSCWSISRGFWPSLQRKQAIPRR